MTRTGRQFEISAGEYRATVVEVGAGLREMWHGARAVVPSYPADLLTPRCAGAVLVPWPNRIRDGRYTFEGTDYQLPLTEPTLRNASHGLGRWARWSIGDHAADRVALELDVVAQTGYPFEVRCSIEYRLDAGSGLAVHATAVNHGDRTAPFGYGSHPYLALGATPLDEVELRIPARARLILDDRNLPVGQGIVESTGYDFRELTALGARRLDDCFVDLITSAGIGVAEVRAGADITRLWWDDAITVLQVFTPDLLVDGPAVAIEPMSCPAEAFNSGTGLVALAPGGRWDAQWGIEIGA